MTAPGAPVPGLTTAPCSRLHLPTWVAALLGAGAAAAVAAPAAPGPAGPVPAAAAASAAAQAPEWWVDLSVRPPVEVPASQRRAQLALVRRQQAEVARQVQALGGRVTGEVTRVRNALVVRIDATQLPHLRELPGVQGVRPMLHLNRPQTSP